MKRRLFVRATIVLVTLAGAAPVPSHQLKPITLPEPKKGGGKPLMQALAGRRITRLFSELPMSLAPRRTTLSFVWTRTACLQQK